ncbi:MAG: ABC transporter substrate-binding protein [Anaerolineae bacterium]|nr:ABC transporter substrate-binding protein [Anaerolineae bacterium]
MKKLLNRRFLVLAAVLIAVVVVAGVSAQDSLIRYASNASDEGPRGQDEAMVARWNEQHPDQPIEHSVTDHEAFKQAIRTYLVADPAPDVLTWFAGNRMAFFVDRGLAADLSPLYEREGWYDSYAPGFVALATAGEGQYFVPTSYYWWAMYFRRSIMEANGLTAPATWDELLATCDTLSAAGITPITIGTRAPWTAAAWFDFLNMRINGPEFHINLMLLKESYTDERVVAVFDHWRQLYEHNCFLPDSAAYEWQEALDFMNRGEAAMYLMGDFIRDSVPDEIESDLDFEMFPVINPDMPIGIDAPTDGFFMSAASGNPEGAYDFLAFIGSAEEQQFAADNLGRLPTRMDVDTSGFSEAQQKGIGLVQSADYVAQFYDRDTTPEMAEAGLNAFAEFISDPMNADVTALLESLEADRVRIAAEQAAE